MIVVVQNGDTGFGSFVPSGTAHGCTVLNTAKCPMGSVSSAQSFVSSANIAAVATYALRLIADRERECIFSDEKRPMTNALHPTRP